MKISLFQLNHCYPALMRLAGREIPKEHHKLAWFLSRVLRSAKTEIDALAESLNDLMRACGFEPGAADVPEDKLKDYSDRATSFMKTTDIVLWGDPIAFDKIAGVVSISPADLVLLDWLIIEEETNNNQADAVV